MNHSHNEKGIVALLTVLIVTAVALILGTTVVLRAIGGSNEAQAQQASAQAGAAANGCAENALGLLEFTSPSNGINATTTWNEYDYDSSTIVFGTPSWNILNIGPNSCMMKIIGSTTDSDANGYHGKIIEASSTVSGLTSKIQAYVSTNTPEVEIGSWGQVGVFSQ